MNMIQISNIFTDHLLPADLHVWVIHNSEIIAITCSQKLTVYRHIKIHFAFQKETLSVHPNKETYCCISIDHKYNKL